jgi:hypothetical protein
VIAIIIALAKKEDPKPREAEGMFPINVAKHPFWASLLYPTLPSCFIVSTYREE